MCVCASGNSIMYRPPASWGCARQGRGKNKFNFPAPRGNGKWSMKYRRYEAPGSVGVKKCSIMRKYARKIVCLQPLVADEKLLSLCLPSGNYRFN